jgi:NAD(P)-dependent dehydrogenase (short-subunit alcohol dehydrogenase family)
MVTVADAAGTVSQLEGRRVLVGMAGMPLGRRLVQGLKRHGARVVEIRTAFTDRAQAETAIVDAANELGGADLIVHASATPAALAARPVDTLSREDWDAAVHRSTLATLFCLQAAHACQRSSGGAVVVIGPSTALVGAAQLVPLMTLAEAQRTLVKAAARQWGALGMRLNWVGVAPSQYDPALAEAVLPQTPELGPPPPALHRVPEAQADIADAVAWLGSAGAGAVTGATINLDGGDWMLP